MTVASFHLVRYPRAYRDTAVSRMAFDRPLLRRTAGLRFARMLGTARGRSVSLSADLDRWALFAVWSEERHLDAFLASSQIAERWHGAGEESCTLRLAYAGGHGSWSGTFPFAEDTPGPDHEGPVAVLTRATIRLRRLVSFYRATPAMNNALADQQGLIRSVGVGEWPLGRLATFSIWRDTAAMAGFAYHPGDHADVVRRTRSEGWFSEEMFVRFRLLGATGTWDGTDPLTGSR